jgi:hypothetical protein
VFIEVSSERSCVCETCIISVCVIVFGERMLDTSIADTVNIVTRSHFIVYQPSDGNSETQAFTRQDVSLETQHDMLVQIAIP